MRVLPSVVASAAGLALAGISDDPIQCLSGCSSKTLTDNATIAGKKCTAATEGVEVSAVSAPGLTLRRQDVQLECICESDVLITALDACILSICPHPFANIDVVQQLRRSCNIGNAAPARRN